MGDDTVGECREACPFRVETPAAPPKIEEKVLLDVLGIHAGYSAAPSEAPGRVADMRTRSDIQCRVASELVHEVLPLIEDGRVARSMATGENSLERVLLCARDGGNAGESLRNHSVIGEEKSSNGGSAAGEYSPAAWWIALVQRPLIAGDEAGDVSPLSFVP